MPSRVALAEKELKVLPRARLTRASLLPSARLTRASLLPSARLDHEAWLAPLAGTLLTVMRPPEQKARYMLRQHQRLRDIVQKRDQAPRGFH